MAWRSKGPTVCISPCCFFPAGEGCTQVSSSLPLGRGLALLWPPGCCEGRPVASRALCIFQVELSCLLVSWSPQCWEVGVMTLFSRCGN